MAVQGPEKQAAGVQIAGQGGDHRRVGFPQRPEQRARILAVQRRMRRIERRHRPEILPAGVAPLRLRQRAGMGPDRQPGALVGAGRPQPVAGVVQQVVQRQPQPVRRPPRRGQQPVQRAPGAVGIALQHHLERMRGPDQRRGQGHGDVGHQALEGRLVQLLAQAAQLQRGHQPAAGRHERRRVVGGFQLAAVLQARPRAARQRVQHVFQPFHPRREHRHRRHPRFRLKIAVRIIE